MLMMVHMMVVRADMFDTRTMCVFMMVIMGVRMAVCMRMGLRMIRSSIPSEKKRQPQARDDQPGCDPKPGIETLGDYVVRSKQRDGAEDIHPRCMRDGDDQSQHEGMPGSSP